MAPSIPHLNILCLSFLSVILLIKHVSSEWWSSEIHAVSQVALSQLRSVQVILLFISRLLVSCVLRGVELLLLLLLLNLWLWWVVLLLVNIGALWEGFILYRWSISSGRFRGKILNRFLNDFIDLLSNLDNLIFSVKISSDYIISFNKAIEFSLKLSILRGQEFRVLIKRLQFKFKIMVSIE